jgi:hypothetical protein
VVKRIMLVDEEVQRVSADAVRAIAKATELFVQQLGMLMTSWQATTFLIGEYFNETDANPVFTVADGLIWLRQSVQRNSMVRKIEIMKMRGQPTLPGLHTFRISKAGIKVFAPAGMASGQPAGLPAPALGPRLLTGVPGLDEMLGGGLPKIEGGANCAMVARQAAMKSGYNQVILYSTHDGQQIYAPPQGWFGDTFAWLQGEFDKDGRASGEAHLLDVGGGMPLASAHADVPPRDPLNLFDGGRNPEREALDNLIRAMELRFGDMARLAYESQRSIAD